MKTISELIKALGGTGPIATRLGFQYQSRVSNWTHIGIPRQHWPEILDFAVECKIKLTFDDLRAIEARWAATSGPDSARAGDAVEAG